MIDWFDLLAVQGTLKSLLQHHRSKASILRLSAFFTVQLSQPYMTTGKTIPLTRHTERLKAGGEGDDRGWDDWMTSPTQRTWVWASSRSWWWTGKPGVLQSMGSQGIRHDWATELNWTDTMIDWRAMNGLSDHSCDWLKLFSVLSMRKR